ncbi:TPA: hypothetical protein DCQ44_00115 [Candidatus Taylorbacteria bacterium]|nr:hypothetical protein [Candidatus Taylorbacteria bacterium]
MKNSQKGFIAPLLIAIIALLAIGGGVYVYENKKAEAPVVINNVKTPPVITPSSTSTPAPTPTPTPTPKPTPKLTPKPSPAPAPIPSGIKLGARPILGAPSLDVTFFATSSDPSPFDNFSIDYGDGSHDSLQQQCFALVAGAKSICQIRTEHKYTSLGTFTATLRGVKNGSSQIIDTIAIVVGNPLNVTKTVGESESSFLIQKINSDSVEGTWWPSTPVISENDPGVPRTLHIGDDVGLTCAGVSDKLLSIDYSGQTITFNKVFNHPAYGCPICLAGNTLIETPSGSFAVKDLQVGMSIWTTDKSGQRISGIITKTSKVPVPPTHQMVHLVLTGGLELFASPGHPTIDGRTVGDLVPGNPYDGASVVSTDRVSYSEGATYDILPSGETGFYWANGVLLGSTLYH